jgi:hypothetical protein
MCWGGLPLKLDEAPDLDAAGAQVGLDVCDQLADDGQFDAE